MKKGSIQICCKLTYSPGYIGHSEIQPEIKNKQSEHHITEINRSNPTSEYRKGVRLQSGISRTGNGFQAGIVNVDGKKLPIPWQVVTYSDMSKRGTRSVDGWFDNEYEIPEKYTRGKNQITLKIEHVHSQKNELNSFYFRVFAYRRPADLNRNHFITKNTGR